MAKVISWLVFIVIALIFPVFVLAKQGDAKKTTWSVATCCEALGTLEMTPDRAAVYCPLQLSPGRPIGTVIDGKNLKSTRRPAESSQSTLRPPSRLKGSYPAH